MIDLCIHKINLPMPCFWEKWEKVNENYKISEFCFPIKQSSLLESLLEREKIVMHNNNNKISKNQTDWETKFIIHNFISFHCDWNFSKENGLPLHNKIFHLFKITPFSELWNF